MFILIGFGAVVLLAWWAVLRGGRFRGARLTTAILATLTTVGLAAWLLLANPVTLGGSPTAIPSPYREILLFIVMLAGMAARFLTRAIENRRERVAAARAAGKTQAVGIEFDSWEFVYPMITSVMTFGLLLQQIGDSSVSTTTVTLAFQNGFFWQTLLGQIEARMAALRAA